MPYPDWVEIHRLKGRAINHVKGHYYLYEVHSERVKGTNKVKKVNDKYLGVITPEGLIPPKSKVKTPILCKTYGVYALLYSFNQITIQRIIKDFPDTYPNILVEAFIRYLHHDFDPLFYEESYLSILFPGLQFDSKTELTEITIERLVKMMTSQLEKEVKNIPYLLQLVHNVTMVHVNDEWHLSTIRSSVETILNQYQIKMEKLLWLK